VIDIATISDYCLKEFSKMSTNIKYYEG